MKVLIPRVEFYITNVCNLTCDGCNRFNNLHFKGHQLWKDYEHIYTEWAKHVDIDHLVILGGEPFLNPSLIEWIEGLNRIWPKAQKQILTNGTRFDYLPELYNACVKTHTWIGVSMHHEAQKRDMFLSIQKFFDYECIFDEDAAGNLPETGGHYVFRKSIHGFKVVIWKQTKFTQNSLRLTNSGKYTLHESDPYKAHKVCNFAQNQVYHFIKGKLYKCGPVALFPELDRQFGLELSNEDRQLMNSYQPFTIENIESHKHNLIAQLDTPVPQCKFCPEQFEFHDLDYIPIKRLTK